MFPLWLVFIRSADISTADIIFAEIRISFLDEFIDVLCLMKPRWNTAELRFLEPLV